MADLDTAPQHTRQGPPTSRRWPGTGGIDRRRLIGWAVVMPLIGGLIVFAVYPFIYLIFLSFSDSNLGTLFRGWVGVEHYTDSINQAKFTTSLLRSIIFALMTTLASVIPRRVRGPSHRPRGEGPPDPAHAHSPAADDSADHRRRHVAVATDAQGRLAQQLPHGHGALQPAGEFFGFAHHGVPVRLPGGTCGSGHPSSR